MLEERDGWFVVNVKDADWWGNAAFGKVCRFDKDGSFEQLGIHIYVLEPGKPNCRYHREDAQEDFLVLAGLCKLLVNGEERPLKPWDFVHCPPGVTHVFVGAGNGPCALLAVGHRPAEQLRYPASELARRYNAEAPEPTSDPLVAYSDVPTREQGPAPEWPVS